MAETSPGGLATIWPALVALAVAAGGAALYFTPLNSDRPDAESGSRGTVLGYQDVDARLWQDPLRVSLLDAITDSSSAAPNNEEVRSVTPVSQPAGSDQQTRAQAKPPAASYSLPTHRLADVQTEIKSAVGRRAKVTVLCAFIPSGFYSELIEQRLRTRVAVLVGLAKCGFRPADSEHVGHFKIGWCPRIFEDPEDGKDPIKDATISNGPVAAWLTIPYEWCYDTSVHVGQIARFQDASGSTESNGSASAEDRRVLVLWLPEDAFADVPLTRLSAFLTAVVPDENEKEVDLKVIGPQTSTELRSIAQEANKKVELAADARVGAAGRSVLFYSPTATASDECLLDSLSPKTRFTEGFFDGKTIGDLIGSAWNKSRFHFQFVRGTVTDKDLCEEAVDELGMRHVNIQDRRTAYEKSKLPGPADDVAIVTELDTFYGRALPYALDQVCASADTAKTVFTENYRPDWIHTYYYLRGIDGQVPGVHALSENANTEEDKKKDSRLLAASDRPEGTNGADYLRRLADSIADEDKSLKLAGRGGLKAVGVLGTDVYDTLMVLRAVRERLPGMLFFTTNLDARYSMGSEWSTCHNLIVVSPFGLSLGQNIQGGIPAFRDSYQTAIFTATVAAMGGLNYPDANRASKSPAASIAELSARRFEIGRHGAFDLSVTNVDPTAEPTSNAFYPSRSDESSLADLNSGKILLLAAFLLVGGLVIVYMGVVPSNAGILDFIRRPLVLASIVFVISIPLASLLARAEQWRGEPFEWFGGISVWPTECIRASASALAVTFLIGGIFEIRKNDREIQRKFKFTRLSRVSRPRRLRAIQDLPDALFPVFARGFKLNQWAVYGRQVRLDPPSSWGAFLQMRLKASTIAKGSDVVYAQNLWWEYLRSSALPMRYLRTAICTVVYLAGATVLFSIFGLPRIPARGSIAFDVDSVATVSCVGLSTFLTFFVLDGTYLNIRFIRYFTETNTHWPTGVFERFDQWKAGLDLTEYLDIRLIAMRTRVVGKAIYQPFLVQALIVISRNSFFDNWDWPLSLIIVLAANLCLTSLAAWLLRSAAEEARGDAIQKLVVRQTARLTSEDPAGAAQLGEVIESIRIEREGAFSMLSQYPTVAALILPSGSFGLWTLLEQLSRLRS